MALCLLVLPFRCKFDSFWAIVAMKVVLAVEESESKWGLLVWLMLFCLLIFKFIFIHAAILPVNIEEAQYFDWSKHLAWSYHSKPPMIAWILSVSRHMFSISSPFKLRIFAPILNFLTSVVLYQCALRLCSRQVGIWVLVSFTLMPASLLSSVIMTTDAPLMFFWSVSMLYMIKALQYNKRHDWILAGAFCGLASLSKYTGMVLVPQLLFFLFLNRDSSLRINKIDIISFLLPVVILLLPNVISSVTTGGGALRHLWQHNVDLKDAGIQFPHFLDFFISQFAVFSVVFFLPLLFWSCRSIFVRRDPTELFLSCLCLPWVLVICAEALMNRAYANWSVTSYLSGWILVAVRCFVGNKKKWLYVNFLVSFSITICLSVYICLIHTNQLPKKYWPASIRKSHDWISFYDIAQQLQRRYPLASFLFADRELWAKASYYGDLSYSKVAIMRGGSGLQNDVKFAVEPPLTKQFIFVSRKGDSKLILGNAPLKTITLPDCGSFCSAFDLTLVNGKGKS